MVSSAGTGLIPNLFPNANRNAFDNGNVVPFTDGCVVSGLITFPLIVNQTGLIGEAGPEAIMPLSRGCSDGMLGVVNSGSVPQVTNNKHTDQKADVQQDARGTSSDLQRLQDGEAVFRYATAEGYQAEKLAAGVWPVSWSFRILSCFLRPLLASARVQLSRRLRRTL